MSREGSMYLWDWTNSMVSYSPDKIKIHATTKNASARIYKKKHGIRCPTYQMYPGLLFSQMQFTLENYHQRIAKHFALSTKYLQVFFFLFKYDSFFFLVSQSKKNHLCKSHIFWTGKTTYSQISKLSFPISLESGFCRKTVEKTGAYFEAVHDRLWVCNA